MTRPTTGGDVTALTDSTGAVVASYEYDAFGNLLKETGTVENPYRYAGYLYDEVTGLYYLQSRYYNPETGRFLTRDSFEGFENEPLSLNRYTYSAPSGNFDLVFQQGGGRMVGRLRSLAKSAKALRLPTIQANL
nr:RHS repeat-associated core domain-containing protein [Kroppenstedtia eburnea]